MYIVKRGTEYLHDITDEILINPKLILEDNQVSNFTFTIDSKHSQYKSIRRLDTKQPICVYKKDKKIFEGRIIDEKEDFLKRKTLYVEGALGYLKDTIQPPKKHQNATVISFLQSLLNIHNAKVDDSRKIYLGVVTVKDPNDNVYRYTNWDNTLSCINDKLLKQYGGHLLIRYENDKRYLDYLKDYPNTSRERIRFGRNLLDFSKNYKIDDLATVIIPLGARIEGTETREEGLEPYVLIDKEKPYIENVDGVKEFGRIEKVVQWENVHEPKILKSKAEKYLKETQFQNLILEVRAVEIEGELNFLDNVRVTSLPHGLDMYFPLRKLEINLLSSQNNIYTLGNSVKDSFVQNVATAQTALEEQIPSKSKLLEEARENATKIINQKTTGYVTTTGSEILIADYQDYTKAKKIWRWNVNGLGYSNQGYNGRFDTAITMDGHIVGERITAGSITAEKLNVQLTDKIDNIETQLQVAKDSISTKVARADLASAIKQVPEAIMYSFNQASQNIEFTSNKYTREAEILVKKKDTQEVVTKINQEGAHFYRDSKYLGKIGTNKFKNNPEVKGLVFDLEPNASYMSWNSKRADEEDSYTTQITYWNKDTTLKLDSGETQHHEADTFEFDCNVEFNGKINGRNGITGTIKIGNAYLEVNKGIIVGNGYY